MSRSRPFSYNTGSLVPGTIQVGDIATGNPLSGFSTTGLEWWNGPDEELGYVISLPVSGETQNSPVKMTWDPSHVGTGNTLSNDNMTITSTGFSSVLGETRIFRNSMFSVQINQDVSSSYIGIGKLDMNINGYVGGSDGKSLGFGSDGNIYFGGSNIGSGFDPWGDTNDVIDVAIDYINLSIWIRVNGSNWNSNPSADPSTNSGGFSIPLSITNTYPAITIYQNPGVPQVTLLAEPAYSIPSGFNFLKNCAAVRFIRSAALTDNSFKDLVNSYFNQNLLTATACKSWLTSNGYWTSWGSLPAGMVLYLDAGLTSSYPGSGSTWYDLSGNNNHGTIIGATYSSSQGGVLEFDGANDYVDFDSVSNIPIGNDNYTVSIWFNTTSSNTTGGFFGWGNYGSTNQVNAFRLLANGQGFVNYWWANDQNFNTTVSPDTWYNVIAKFDGTNREIWLDGTLVGSVPPSPGHNVPSADNLTIGLTAPFLNEYFPGKIGQVVFYRRGATDQEIQDIYNSGLERFTGAPAPGPTQSGFTVTITESGSNVVMAGSGTLNIDDLTLVAGATGPMGGAGIGINSATFILGANGGYYDLYSGILTNPGNFGTGSGIGSNSSAGDIVGVIYNGAPPHMLIVPTGYTSGSYLTSSQTFNNKSFSSLGLVAGTYSYTWGTGSNAEILSVVVGGTSSSGGGGGATGAGWQFYYNEGAIGGTPPPMNDGEIIFFYNTAQTITYNPNYSGVGSFQILLNENQSDGSSSLSAFNTLDSSGGTIALSQGSNTVIYSGGSIVYFVQNFGGSNALVIDAQVATLVQSASAPFVSGTPITITIS